MKRLLLICSAPLFFSGCATVATVQEVSDLTIQVAEYRTMQAEQQNALWQGTQQLLEQARQQQAAGDFKAALELAREARFQGETAYQQSLSQQNARPWQF